jgi:hypothetical protein
VEGDWRISPFALLGTGSPKGVRYAGLPLVPAGKVTVDVPARLRSEPHLYLHVLGARKGRGPLRWELLVSRRVAELGDGVLMPAGRVVAGLWDRYNRDYVALSRPFQVPPGVVMVAPLRLPERGGDYVVEARWRITEPPYEDAAAKFWIQAGERRIEPDLVVVAGLRSYAFWYELEVAEGDLRADTPSSLVDGQRMSARPGAVEHRGVFMAAKPSLEVEVHLPPALGGETSTLRLEEVESKRLVASREVSAAHLVHRFERLMPGTFQVSLETPVGRTRETVYLHQGKDGRVVLEPKALVLHGRVLRGAAGCPAKLTFTGTSGDTRAVVTDREGAYRAILPPVRSVSIAPAGAEGESIVEGFDPFLEESGERDFRLPNVHLHVRVVDQVSGKGISEARVIAHNAYLHEEAGRESPRERGLDVTTDGNGRVVLPLIGPGTVEVWARVPGYLWGSTVEVTLAEEGDDDPTLEVALVPDGVTVRVLLPQGAPAAGAHAVLVPDLAWGATSFSTIADDDGLLHIPKGEEGVLVVKHPWAGFASRPWHPRRDEDEQVQLTEPSAVALQVLVTDVRGVPVAGAHIGLWVQGQRLSEGVVTFLTGRSPRTDGAGYWTAEGLPLGFVAVLAWSSRPGVQDLADRGLLDFHAVNVVPPWPTVVDVRLAK